MYSILFIAVTATIAGADGPEDMEKFAKRKRDWLERFIDLSHGVPSHDTLGRVLGIIKPKQFQDAFLSWISSLTSLRGQDGKPIFIPIDGKTMRGSYTNALAICKPRSLDFGLRTIAGGEKRFTGVEHPKTLLHLLAENQISRVLILVFEKVRRFTS